MKHNQLHLRAQREPWGRGVTFALLQELSGDRVAVGRPVEMEESDGASTITPCFELTPEAAQVLMDDLWTAGFRPTEGSGTAGQLAATQKHLEDMRQLVWWSYDPVTQAQLAAQDLPRRDDWSSD